MKRLSKVYLRNVELEKKLKDKQYNDSHELSALIDEWFETGRIVREAEKLSKRIDKIYYKERF